MTDKPYRGRKGGRYVRASRDEEPRRVGGTTPDGGEPPAPDETGGDATPTETAPSQSGSDAKQTAGKSARKRS